MTRDGKSHREPLDVNNRGQYYARHNHSFDGYVEPVKTVDAPQLFRFIERFTLPDNTRRVAVADVMGDNKPRLICLNEKPDAKDQSVLTVQRWNGKAFVTEFRADTPGAPDKLAVGKFTSDGKAVILTSGDGVALERQNVCQQGRRADRKPARQSALSRRRLGARPDGGQYGRTVRASREYRAVGELSHGGQASGRAACRASQRHGHAQHARRFREDAVARDN